MPSCSHPDPRSRLTLGAHLPVWGTPRNCESKTGQRPLGPPQGLLHSQLLLLLQQVSARPRKVMPSMDTRQAQRWAARGQGQPQSQGISRGMRKCPSANAFSEGPVASAPPEPRDWTASSFLPPRLWALHMCSTSSDWTWGWGLSPHFSKHK